VMGDADAGEAVTDTVTDEVPFGGKPPAEEELEAKLVRASICLPSPFNHLMEATARSHVERDAGSVRDFTVS
jgi:hypothetical protein